MLDRTQLIKELHTISHELFADESPAYQQLLTDWKKVCSDPLIRPKLKAACMPWPVPTWEGKLNECYPVHILPPVYHIISVDGSQIYPDRHLGVSCYLINTGTVIIHYDGRAKPVIFSSVPTLFTGQEHEEVGDISTELINGKRQDLELRGGFECAATVQPEIGADPFLLLFDGSLIFWHLEAKNSLYKELFFSRYIASLMSLHAKRIPTASYISAPKSRELINIIRAYRCGFDQQQDMGTSIRFSDAALVRSFLQPGERTILFRNHAAISEEYPDAVRPYFFYLHVGTEIGRVEIPAWVAHDEQLINQVAVLVLDQSRKGNGYPVALAEAHEQAVVKGADREFFYHLLAKIGMQHKRSFDKSFKLMKKQRMAI